MNDAVSQMMDAIAMGASVLIAVLLSLYLYRKATQRLRAIPLFLTLFGPVAIAVHMAMHFIGVGIVAGQKIGAGKFTYDFRFYSLLLMAGVLSVLSVQLIAAASKGIVTKQNTTRQRLVLCGWIVLVSVPTIPFTFIGSLPAQAVFIHLIAARFVAKRKKAIVAPMTLAGKSAPEMIY